MAEFEKMLAGGDLRSLGKSNSVVSEIQNQHDFDALFKCLFHADRVVVMRAGDVIEKITINNPQYLVKHKKAILKLCDTVEDKELKWHLALLIPRLHLKGNEFGHAWNMLTEWAKDIAGSRIVRVNSIEGLFEMLKQESTLEKDLNLTLAELEKENIPSISARIKSIRRKITLLPSAR